MRSCFIVYLPCRFIFRYERARFSWARGDLSYEDFKQFSRKSPFLCTLLTCGLGSLAGIPPLGGFIAKLFLFVAAYQANLHLLLLVSIIGVVISIYYYFSWIRVCLFTEHTDSQIVKRSVIDLGPRDYCVLGSLLFASFLLGFYILLLFRLFPSCEFEYQFCNVFL